MHAPLRQTYQVEWRSLAELASIADEWQALAASAIEPNVFYEPAFALAAAPVFGTDTRAVLVRTMTGKLVGLFPGHPGRLMMAGWVHPYAPLGVPLVDRAEPEAVIAVWLDHLGQDPAMPGQLLLPFLPEQGAFARGARCRARSRRPPQRSLQPPRARAARARRPAARTTWSARCPPASGRSSAASAGGWRISPRSPPTP